MKIVLRNGSGETQVREEDGRVVVALKNFTGELVMPQGVDAKVVLEAIGREKRQLQGETESCKETEKSRERNEEKNSARGGAKAAARWGASLTTIAPGTMMLYGGESDSGAILGDVNILALRKGRSTDQAQWSQPTGCAGEPVAWHSATFLPNSGHVLVFGGLNAEGTVSEQCSVFDCDINLWYPLTTNGTKPGARMGHSACLMGDNEHQLMVFGGNTGRKDTNELWVLDTSIWRWTKGDVQGKLPKPRSHHQAVSSKSRMVIVGGRVGDAAYDDVHVLLPVQGGSPLWEWSSPIVTGALFRPRCGHQAIPLESGEILVFGGWNPDPKKNQVHSDAFVLDVDDNHFSDATYRFPELARSASRRFGHATAVATRGDSKWLICFGGKLAADPNQVCDEQTAMRLGGNDADSGGEGETCSRASLVDTSSPMSMRYSTASFRSVSTTTTPPPFQTEESPSSTRSLARKKQKLTYEQMETMEPEELLESFGIA